jgi:Fe-S oxidoreductase
MSDPAAALYGGVPGYVLLWAAAIVSFSLFGLRAARYVRVLASARREARWDRWPRRIARFALHVLGQRRMFEERAIGAAHLIIFWSFVFYAAGFFWNLLRGLFPFLPIPYADHAPVMGTALTVFGALGLAALAVAAVRRYFFAPPGLERSRDATVILILIAAVLGTSLAGQWLSSRGDPAANALWWAHMLIVLGFLAYLPYSKHLHLLASPFGVLFSSLDRARMPAASEGAEEPAEFTWRQLFSGLACAECGRCDRACPSVSSGAALSPKRLMHEVKDAVRGGGRILGGRVTPEQVWACSTCGACMERCPVWNEHIPLIIEMRRRLVLQGAVDARLQEALSSLNRYGNSFGAGARARAKWTAGLDFKIKDARKEPVEYLWFTGDYASFDPRVQPAARAFARLLHRAGVDFGILYEAEQNSGNDARRAGEEGLFELLMEKNRKALKAARFEKIVTTDPHTFHALRNEYAAWNGAVEVLHSSQLIGRLLRGSRLPVESPLRVRAAFHDPCYLGRYNGVYDAPREVLRAIGVDLAEMPRNRSAAFCCGAGGGRIWMEDAPAGAERPAESRVREAAALGVSTLVAACPKDVVMFIDAVKTSGLEDKLSVRELAELVEEAAAPKPEGAVHA